MDKNKILSFIGRVRDSFPEAVDVYTQGSCIKFAMILLELMPAGRILYNSDHAIFEYENNYYDINGLAEYNKHLDISEYGVLQMYDLMNLTYKK